MVTVDLTPLDLPRRAHMPLSVIHLKNGRWAVKYWLPTPID